MKIKKYQLVLTIVFLGMTLASAFGLNVVPAGVVRETHTATTSDGVSISFDVYYESNIPANRPVIVIGHGVFVNKEMMTNYAMELAARDFVVASLDWRGHGWTGHGAHTSGNSHGLDQRDYGADAVAGHGSDYRILRRTH